jgi:hypothetical protein
MKRDDAAEQRVGSTLLSSRAADVIEQRQSVRLIRRQLQYVAAELLGFGEAVLTVQLGRAFDDRREQTRGAPRRQH